MLGPRFTLGVGDILRWGKVCVCGGEWSTLLDMEFNGVHKSPTSCISAKYQLATDGKTHPSATQQNRSDREGQQLHVGMAGVAGLALSSSYV